MVEQLARFLGVACDKTQLEALTEHCHQLVDQCCNAEALPVGRGMRPCPLAHPPARRGPGPHIRALLPRGALLWSTVLRGGEKVIWKPGRTLLPPSAW